MEYLLRRVDERHDTTKEIIETKDGDVARLVAVDGKPLSAEADRAELARLDDLKSIRSSRKGASGVSRRTRTGSTG